MKGLIGFPNKVIYSIGSELMNNQDFAKLMYYKYEKIKDIDELPIVENPVKQLYNKQVFYCRRYEKLLTESDIVLYINHSNKLPYQYTSQAIKTIQIEIGVACHFDCRESGNGLRDLALTEVILDCLLDSKNIPGVGRLYLVQNPQSYNMPYEYSGYYMTLACEQIDLKGRK